MSSIQDHVDRYFAARAEIFKHVGYTEDYRVLPIEVPQVTRPGREPPDRNVELDDYRDVWWAVDEHERRSVKFSPSRDALQYWLEEHDDEYGEHADELYENAIYTQRHLPKWVYRGSEVTMIVVDTRTDMNKKLQLFLTDHEIKLPKPGDSW